MLRDLHLKRVGPSARLDIELAKRLNIITGDNGLGKSFLLDVAWWALTHSWVGAPAMPDLEKGATPQIAYAVRTPDGPVASEFSFARESFAWVADMEPLPPEALVVYARVDG